MIDNFNLIQPFLNFTCKDDFYFLQILKRKKEHKELGSNSLTIKTYYITSIEHFEKLKQEIIILCNLYQARAYINLNKRSFKKVAFFTLRKITEQICNGEYTSIPKAYNSTVGRYSSEQKNNKKWIVDLDGGQATDSNISNITWFINKMYPLDIPNKILTQIPTKTGVHLITCPFSLQEFKHLYDKIGVHKDNPTLLYLP